MRTTLKRFIPGPIHEKIREYRELPPSARAFWLAALRERTLSGRDITHLPAELPDAPRVLVICYGNIFRSPYAKALLEQMLANRAELRVTVTSAGLFQAHGRTSPPEALTLAAARGHDLSGHRSHTVTAEELEAADVVLIMDRRNEALLRAHHPSIVRKLVLLGAFDPLAPLLGPTISDPYGRGDEALEACFDRLERSVMRFVEAIGGRVPAEPRNRMRRTLRRAATSAVLAPVWQTFTDKAAAILMLHRFEDREAGIAGHSPELLRSHLEHLRAERFNIISLDALVSRALAGEPLPPRTVSFTVDDGYVDFARVGIRLFAEYDVPVTLFATTRFLDGDHWQWYDAVSYLCATRPQLDVALGSGADQVRITFAHPHERPRAVRRAVEQMKLLPRSTIEAQLVSLQAAVQRELPARPTARFMSMGWSQLDTMGGQGARFGAHTETHVILARESAERAEREIRTSVDRIAAATSHVSRVFAYPNGLEQDFGEREERLAAQSGCLAAVASTGGHCTAPEIRARPFALSRVPYSEDLYGMRQSLMGLERAKKLARRIGM